MSILFVSLTFVSWYHLVLSVTGFSKHAGFLQEEKLAFLKKNVSPKPFKQISSIKGLPQELCFYSLLWESTIIRDAVGTVLQKQTFIATRLKCVPDSFRARNKLIAWACGKPALHSALTCGSPQLGYTCFLPILVTGQMLSPSLDTTATWERTFGNQLKKVISSYGKT